jgi:hypothetical protein
MAEQKSDLKSFVVGDGIVTIKKSHDKPVTQQGLVTINAKPDVQVFRYRKGMSRQGSRFGPLRYPIGTDREHNVLPYELVFARPLHQNMYEEELSPTLRVFSSFNGMAPGDELIDFVGLANTRSTLEQGQYSHGHNQLSIQVSGMTSTYNTGKETIRTGQYVAWDFPHVVYNRGNLSPQFQDQSRPSKYVATLVPVDLSTTPLEAFLSGDVKALKDIHAPHVRALDLLIKFLDGSKAEQEQLFGEMFKGGAHNQFSRMGSTRYKKRRNELSNGALKKAVDKLIQNKTAMGQAMSEAAKAALDNENTQLILTIATTLAQRAEKEIRSRIIGRACSTARGGEPIEILLTPNAHY